MRQAKGSDGAQQIFKPSRYKLHSERDTCERHNKELLKILQDLRTQ